jgi:hypothetical protein
MDQKTFRKDQGKTSPAGEPAFGVFFPYTAISVPFARYAKMEMRRELTPEQGDRVGWKEGSDLLEKTMLYASLTLLWLSCADRDMVGTLAKLLWLVSVGVLSLVNYGAAFGVYVASVSLYSVLRFEGWGSIFQRPDNYALVILIFSFAVTRLRWRFVFRNGPMAAVVVVFLAYSLIQMAVLGAVTRDDFAWFMRMFGLPFLILLLLAGGSIAKKDWFAFSSAMMMLALYTGIVSVMERFDLYPWIIPSWVRDAGLNVTIGSGRSGGLLLQSEWNGFALSLAYCFLLLRIATGEGSRAFTMAVLVICLAGLYTTYTRAAWFAAFAATSLVFLKRPHIVETRERVKRAAFGLTAVVVLTLLILFPCRIARERAGHEETIYFRINLWSAGLNMAARKPIWGHGFGQFRQSIHDYDEGAGKIPYTSIPEEGTVAHNTLLNIMVEQGLLGSFLYSLIFLYMCSTGWKTFNRLLPRQGSSWPAAFLIVYLINTQFIVAYEPTTNFIFYGTMGFLIGLRNETFPGKVL